MKQEKDGNKNSLFYDTYALYAVAKGENSYREFSKGHRIFTSLMNLYEFYYILIKENNEQLAQEFFNELVGSCIEISSDIVKEAAKFRLKEIKRKLSYVDCLGYIIAKKKDIKFLTGDDGFKDLGNVKFVK